MLIALTHLLWISFSDGNFWCSPWFSISHSQRSFQIRCADSRTRIAKSLLRPFFLVLFVLIQLGRFAPRIDPKEISGHEGSLLHHNSLASLHTVWWILDSRQSTRMCCIDSVSPHNQQVPLFSKFGMFLQYEPILYLLWRHFQRKFLMFFGMSRLLIDFQSRGGVGVASHKFLTERWVAAMLFVSEVLGEGALPSKD